MYLLFLLKEYNSSTEIQFQLFFPSPVACWIFNTTVKSQTQKHEKLSWPHSAYGAS